MEAFRNFRKFFKTTYFSDIQYVHCGKLSKKQQRLYVKKL